MPIYKKDLTKEMVVKAMQCKTPDELMEMAKAGGFTITREEAESYMAELADVELDGEQLKSIAGGYCWHHCDGYSCEWDYEYI